MFFQQTDPYDVIWRPLFEKLSQTILLPTHPSVRHLKKDGHFTYIKRLVIKNRERTVVEDDELLDDVVIAEYWDRDMDEVTGHVKHLHQDAVQLRIEKAVLDFCLKKGSQPYGVVLDALSYLSHGHSLESGYFKAEAAKKRFQGKSVEDIKEHVINISSLIEEAFLRAVSEYGINNLDAKTMFSSICRRYSRYAEDGQRREWGSRSKEMPVRNTYDVLWSPWFKGLDEKFKKAREYFEGEKDKLLI